jgi:thermitase
VALDDGRTNATALANGIRWAADAGARVICMSLGSDQNSRAVEEAVDYAWSRGVVLVSSAGKSGTSAPSYPAAYENCIAVAATDPNDQRMSSSHFGPWVEVAAPGAGIFSTTPSGYGVMGGTSQAAAFAAGVAALIWSSGGGSNIAVRARLEATCDPIAGTGSSWVHGRINAARAVGAIQ